jgi:murein DD-endopeptidase MepM/ murein hydrolase activator NlpD
MAKQIIIPSWKEGGTLSAIAQKYGTSISELMKLNPSIKDPDKIQKGAKLNVPDMAGTLNTKTSTPTGGATGYPEIGSAERTLPDTSAGDNLSKFKTLFNTITERNIKARKDAGLATIQDMGFEPSKVGGGTMQDIIGFVNNYSTQGIEDAYTQTLNTVDEIMKKSQENIKLLIDSGGIADIDDKTLMKLANASEIDYDVLLGIRNAKIRETKKPKSFSTITKGGIEYRVGYDANGNEVVSVPTGGDVTNPGKTSINNLPDEEQILVKLLQESVDKGEVTFEEALNEFPEYVRYLESPSSLW